MCVGTEYSPPSLRAAPGTGRGTHHCQEVRHDRRDAVSAGAPELLSGADEALTIEAAGSEREIAARSPMQLFWRRLRRDKVAMVALGFVILIVLTAILAPLIVKVAGTPQPNLTNADLTDD